MYLNVKNIITKYKLNVNAKTQGDGSVVLKNDFLSDLTRVINIIGGFL